MVLLVMYCASLLVMCCASLLIWFKLAYLKYCFMSTYFALLHCFFILVIFIESGALNCIMDGWITD